MIVEWNFCIRRNVLNEIGVSICVIVMLLFIGIYVRVGDVYFGFWDVWYEEDCFWIDKEREVELKEIVVF